MKKIALQSAMTAALLAMFSSAAMAANTTELKVNGVIKPAACAPSFSGGGVADYGVIPASSLQAGQFTRLVDKQIPFNITCDASTKMGLRAVDNRASSYLSLPDSKDFWGDNTTNFGLGRVNNIPVGGYNLQLRGESVTTDGSTARQIYRMDSQDAWATTAAGGTLGKNRTFSWTTAGGSQPAAFKTVAGMITVSTYLNKPENLPLTQEIPLDGSATLEVVYM